MGFGRPRCMQPDIFGQSCQTQKNPEVAGEPPPVTQQSLAIRRYKALTPYVSGHRSETLLHHRPQRVRWRYRRGTQLEYRLHNPPQQVTCQNLSHCFIWKYYFWSVGTCTYLRHLRPKMGSASRFGAPPTRHQGIAKSVRASKLHVFHEQLVKGMGAMARLVFPLWLAAALALSVWIAPDAAVAQDGPQGGSGRPAAKASALCTVAPTARWLSRFGRPRRLGAH